MSVAYVDRVSSVAVASEASARAAADAAINSAVASKQDASTAATDTELAAEATRAAAAEATKALATDLTSEASTRASADTALATRATNLEATAPTPGQKNALAGTQGTPGSTNQYVTTQDSRNSDARTPTAHKASHATGGTDALAPADIGAATATALTTETSRATAAEGLAAQKASNLSDIASASSARTNLGLGSAATQPSSAFDAAGLAAAEQTRALAAEATNASAVTSEATRAAAAEALLIPLTQKGAASGVASLDSEAQVADLLSHEFSPLHLAKWAGVYGGVRVTAPAVCSLRFDDVPAADYTTLFPLLKARDLVGAQAVTKNYMSPPGSGCTIAQLLEMQSRGMEMMAHSRTHGDPTTDGGYTNFVDEAITVTDELEALNLHIQSFAQPGTWTSAYYLDGVAKLRGRLARRLMERFAVIEAYDATTDGSVSGATANVKPFPTINRLATTQVTLNQVTLAAAKALIDKAVNYGGHIHLMTHMLTIDTASNMTLADFTSVLDYVQAKRDAGWLDVLTPTAAHFAQRGEAFNLLGDASFDLTALGSYPSTAGLPWTIESGFSAPTVVAGIGGHHGVQTQQSTTSVYQRLVAANTRTLRFEGYAKGVTAGNTLSRLNVKLVAADGSTVIQQTNIDTTVTDVAWTKVTASFGNDPRAYFWQIKPNVGEATKNVIWSDMKVVRV